MIYEVQTIGNKLSFKPIAFVSSGLQSGQSADHGIVLVDGQGTLQNTPVAYIFWSLHPEWRLAYDPRSWWCEPREINMRSKMTPPTLQSTDLNPVAGQRSSDLKTWEAVRRPDLAILRLLLILRRASILNYLLTLFAFFPTGNLCLFLTLCVEHGLASKPTMIHQASGAGERKPQILSMVRELLIGTYFC
jgi:hypothetical protein